MFGKNVYWKLTPSSFAWLYDSCARCFWAQVRLGVRRPSAPFPKVFTLIDSLMKEHLEGKPTSVISQALKPGHISHCDAWVRSRPIVIPGHATGCYMIGKLDTKLVFDDGSFGVADYKTAHPRDEHLGIYARQLMSYAWALEHPAYRTEGLSPIDTLGIFAVHPVRMEDHRAGYAFTMNGTWHPVQKDDDRFLSFVDEVLDVLELPEPPEAGEDCGWCRYRSSAA